MKEKEYDYLNKITKIDELVRHYQDFTSKIEYFDDENITEMKIIIMDKEEYIDLSNELKYVLINQLKAQRKEIKDELDKYLNE